MSNIRLGCLTAIILFIIGVIIAGITDMWGGKGLGFAALIVFVFVIVPLLFLFLLGLVVKRIKTWSRIKTHGKPDSSKKIRKAIPAHIQRQVYARARGRCERPRCSYHGKLHIHHIDKNPSNNSPDNLIAVCPNCHQRIHDGSFSFDAVRSWIMP